MSTVLSTPLTPPRTTACSLFVHLSRLRSIGSHFLPSQPTAHISNSSSPLSYISNLIMSSVLSTLSNLVSSTDTIQPITETKKWRWGIMGSGGICQDFSHAVRDCVPDAILQAIGARTLASAQKVKEQLGFVTAYGSFEEVAADPNVDVVYVGSVHNKHYEHAMLALKHNKPVLVEKAFMQNAKQAEEIFKVAKGQPPEQHSSTAFQLLRS